VYVVLESVYTYERSCRTVQPLATRKMQTAERTMLTKP